MSDPRQPPPSTAPTSLPYANTLTYFDDQHRRYTRLLRRNAILHRWALLSLLLPLAVFLYGRAFLQTPEDSRAFAFVLFCLAILPYFFLASVSDAGRISAIFSLLICNFIAFSASILTLLQLFNPNMGYHGFQTGVFLPTFIVAIVGFILRHAFIIHTWPPRPPNLTSPPTHTPPTAESPSSSSPPASPPTAA